MPHLAPLFWAFAPLMFFTVLYMLHSSTWWTLTPYFPKMLMMKSSNNIFNLWQWK
uniref:ATP synthase F0 subunit 8 n=1 Tax=Polychaeta sp. TaxID=3061522 RepID=A0AAU8L265_9ANNE